jgi:hypothetical protein
MYRFRTTSELNNEERPWYEMSFPFVLLAFCLINAGALGLSVVSVTAAALNWKRDNWHNFFWPWAVVFLFSLASTANLFLFVAEQRNPAKAVPVVQKALERK